MDMDMAWGVVDAACRNAAPAFCQDYLTTRLIPVLLLPTLMALSLTGPGEHTILSFVWCPAWSSRTQRTNHACLVSGVHRADGVLLHSQTPTVW